MTFADPWGKTLHEAKGPGSAGLHDVRWTFRRERPAPGEYLVTLKAGERRLMPVVFVVDPSLPRDIPAITLSYTFFEVAGAVKDQAAAPSAPRARSGPPRSARSRCR